MSVLVVALQRTSCLRARQLTQWQHYLPPLAPRLTAITHLHSKHTAPQQDATVHVFYRWPTIRHLRLLSRCKLYQVVLMLLFLPPATLAYKQGSLAGSTLTAAYIGAGGTLAVLVSMSHLFTKVIGEMAYLPATDQVCVSTLTFFGGRRDILVSPHHILPQGGRGLVQKLEIVGHGGVFRYSLRYGQVIDADITAHILLNTLHISQ